jgi:hypothetical protein
LNSMVFATRQPTTIDDFIANYNRFQSNSDIHPLLLSAMSSAIVNAQSDYEPTQVFTDDKAPIEWLTNNLIINFMLKGDVETLQ